MKRLIATMLFTAGAFAAGAQERPVVTARLEPDSVFIGDRFDYVIEVEKDLVQVVEFPEFRNAGEGLELVASLPVDTLEREGRSMKLRKRYRMATFEEGRFNLGTGQVLYADKNIIDTLYTADSLLLRVGTFQIDSTSQSIYDLKMQKTLPFRFAEIRSYVLWGLALLAVLLVGLYGVVRYLRQKGKGLGSLFKPAPPLPPHVEAIKALETLHNQKLWQNSRYKAYYSALSDILRNYIVRRWGIGALEMTSDEIIAAMRGIELPDKARMDLGSLLRDADLVKFAKAEPEPEQNENDYLKCYYFVEETKLEVDPSEGQKPNTEYKIED